MNKKLYIVLISIVFLTSFIFTMSMILLNNGDSNAAKYEQPIDPLKSYYEGDYDKAIYYYENLIDKNNADEEDLRNLAVLYKENGELENTISIYEKLLNKSEKNTYYNYLIGKYYYQLANYTKAELYLEKVINSNKKVIKDINNIREESFYYFLAKTYMELNKYKNAEETLMNGINENQDFPLNYLALAKLYNLQGNVSSAVNYYNKAVRKDNNISQVYPLMAKGHEELNNEALAYNYWKKSLLTGNSEDLAKKKINELKKEFPYLEEKEEEEKKIKRTDINWMNIREAADNEKIKNVRVGIVDKVDEISFQSNKAFQIQHNGQQIATGEDDVEWKIKRNNGKYNIYRKGELIKTLSTTKELEIKSIEENSIFMVYDITYGSGYFWAGSEDRQYRGNFELYTLDSNKFNLVNIVNMAEYLYSVVPAEMPALWPVEALKAQTIAARSYLLKHFDRHLDDGYNVCDSVHCAAYNGIKSEHKRSYKAVNDTLREVAYFNGRIVDAVFSSNSGGYTESSEDVWGYDIEYLSGVSTMLDEKYEFPLDIYEFEKWIKTTPPSYSDGKYTFDNVYRWIKTIDVNYFKEKYNFKELKDIKVMGRSKGGSVKSIKIKGITKNSEEISTKNIEKDYIRGALAGLRSNRFMIDKIYNKKGKIKNIIIYGAGWGHNVGMDQTAAASMADKGYNYKEIINYFYEGSEISKYNLQ